jgi:predicted nucleic acid-binding protein
MSADPPREFVDANVLVYAFDSSAVRKQQTARQLLERLWNSGSGCVSVQVLQEFFVAVTKKVPNPLPVDEARARIREFAAWTVFTPTAGDIVAAIDLHTESKIGFRDAMIVLAASESECDVLWDGGPERRSAAPGRPHTEPVYHDLTAASARYGWQVGLQCDGEK